MNERELAIILVELLQRLTIAAERIADAVDREASNAPSTDAQG